MNSFTEKNEPGPACEFKENLSILREINFFSELPIDVLKVLAYLCKRETFRAEDYLFRQKDDDGQAFYILCGQARLEYQDEKKALTIRDIAEGTFLGSLALLGKAPRLFSLRALTDTTCLIISREIVSKVLEQFPNVLPRMLKALVANVNGWEEKFLLDSDGSCEKCLLKIGVSMI